MRTLQLKEFIEEETSRKCGVGEMPQDYTLPVFVIHQMPSMARTGSLAKPNEMEERNYQIDVVGETYESAEEADRRLTAALSEGLHQQFSTVTGPPTIRHNGESRSDDRRYHRMIMVTLYLHE